MNYICVSGGADSTAMALLAWEQGEKFEMVFSDTGAELPETYWLLPRLSEKVGKKLNVVTNASFFQRLSFWGYFLPGPHSRWCTKELKQVPQDYYWEMHETDSVMVGIRADEPRRLTEREKFRYPLAEAGMDKKAVKKLCEKHGLLNPVYQWRTNVSCFCCFFQKKADWKGLMINHPTLYAVAQEWERQSIKATKNSHTWNEAFSLKQFKEAKEAQVEMWPEPDAEPCLICSI
jgi:PP-loop superfamily ATP-utilizing enzyme